jgi:hypothetical protein
MQNNPLPVTEESDLTPACEFLTTDRDESRNDRTASVRQDAPCKVIMRNGISRARMRSASKTSA